MRHHQLASIEPQMAHQAVDEGHHEATERGRLALHLLCARRQAVGELDVAPMQPAQELGVMIAQDAEGDARRHHRVHDLEHVRRPRPTVHEIAEKDRATPLWGNDHACASFAGRPGDQVAQLREERLQLVGAAVHVADDVERAILVPHIGPQALARDLDAVDRLDRAQLVHVAETLLVDAADVAPQARHVVAHHVRAVLAVGPPRIAFAADVLAWIEHDGDGQRVVFLGDAHELCPVLLAHIGGVNHDDLAPLEAGFGDDV
jgi:hypothetical protein